MRIGLGEGEEESIREKRVRDGEERVALPCRKR